MNDTNALKTLKPLLSKPYFTSADAKALGVHSSHLAYYIKKGSIERIGRGLYRGMDAPSMREFRWEDLVLAMAKVNEGVICLTSALALYDLTDEIPRQHWIAIRNETRHRGDPSIKVIRMRNLELGKTSIDIDNVKLAIFDRERTIVDTFRYLSKETAIKALKMAVQKKRNEKINLAKIQRYAKLLRINIEPYLLMVST